MEKKTTPTKIKTPAGVVDAIIQQWQARIASLGYKTKAASTKRAEVEYVVGALSALDALGYVPHPRLVIPVLTGRSILDNFKNEN